MNDRASGGPADAVAATPTSWDVVIRRLAAASAAGALLGLLIGGVGGRLAMALLAGQNPEDAGRLSDDGFTIGQFTVEGTVLLLGASLQLGLVGAVIYLALSPLAIGPPWLRVTSLTAGGTVVFAAALVDPDGVDFTILDPSWLPVALFVAIPATFVVLLSLLAERWLAPTSWFATAPVRTVAGVLLVWIPTGPLLLLLAAALGVGVAWRQLAARASRGARLGVAWVARLLLGVWGGWALVTLIVNIEAVP